MESSDTKLIHQNFRIPMRLKKMLEKESQETGNSSTAILVRILDNYFRYYKPFEQLGFMMFGKDIVREWMEVMNEDTLRKIATELGTEIISEYIAHMYHRVDSEALIEFLSSWFSTISKYKHEVNDKTHYYSVVHDVNMNFSIFLAEMLREFIEGITCKPVTFVKVTPNLIAFSFEV